MWESLSQLYVKFLVGYFQNELEGLFDNLVTSVKMDGPPSQVINDHPPDTCPKSTICSINSYSKVVPYNLTTVCFRSAFHVRIGVNIFLFLISTVQLHQSQTNCDHA